MIMQWLGILYPVCITQNNVWQSRKSELVIWKMQTNRSEKKQLDTERKQRIFWHLFKQSRSKQCASKKCKRNHTFFPSFSEKGNEKKHCVKTISVYQNGKQLKKKRNKKRTSIKRNMTAKVNDVANQSKKNI